MRCFHEQRAASSIYSGQDSCSKCFAEIFAFLPRETARMYPAVVERHYVFPEIIRFHTVTSQRKGDHSLYEKLIKDWLDFCVVSAV